MKTTFAGCVRLRDVDMEPKPQQQMHVSRFGTSCTSAAMSSFLHSRRYSFSICIMHSDRERERQEVNRCDKKEEHAFLCVCARARACACASQSVSQSYLCYEHVFGSGCKAVNAQQQELLVRWQFLHSRRLIGHEHFPKRCKSKANTLCVCVCVCVCVLLCPFQVPHCVSLPPPCRPRHTSPKEG